MGVEPTTLWLQSVSLLKFSKGMYRLCLDRMSDPRACGLHWRTATACRTRFLGRTKTTTADDRTHVVVLIGRPVEALKQWIEEARIDTGPVFRRIDQWGNIDRRALTPQSVNLILKTRCSQARFGSGAVFGAWTAIRISDGSRQSRHPFEGSMQQSLHKPWRRRRAIITTRSERTDGGAFVFVALRPDSRETRAIFSLQFWSFIP